MLMTHLLLRKLLLVTDTVAQGECACAVVHLPAPPVHAKATCQLYSSEHQTSVVMQLACMQRQDHWCVCSGTERETTQQLCQSYQQACYAMHSAGMSVAHAAG